MAIPFEACSWRVLDSSGAQLDLHADGKLGKLRALATDVSATASEKARAYGHLLRLCGECVYIETLALDSSVIFPPLWCRQLALVTASESGASVYLENITIRIGGEKAVSAVVLFSRIHAYLVRLCDPSPEVQLSVHGG